MLVMSAHDPLTGEVYAFEELVGSHGGLGGGQTRPFVFHPVELPYPDEPVVGAESLHRVLVSWVNPSEEAVREVESQPVRPMGVTADVATPSGLPRE